MTLDASPRCLACLVSSVEFAFFSIIFDEGGSHGTLHLFPVATNEKQAKLDLESIVLTRLKF